MAAVADGGLITIALAAGMALGAVVAVLIARRRGHVRVNIELGDPPTPRRSDDDVTPDE